MQSEEPNEQEIRQLVDNFMESMKSDYLGLFVIAGWVRSHHKTWSSQAVKQETIEVVRRLLLRGAYAGDYLNAGFQVWPQSTASEVIARIDRKWDATKDERLTSDLVCWFCSQELMNRVSSRSARQG